MLFVILIFWFWLVVTFFSAISVSFFFKFHKSTGLSSADRFIQNNIQELDKIRDLDVIFQIDAGSLIGHFGDKVTSTAFSMLKKGYCDIIGSDAHNNRNRNFCIKESYDLLSKLDDNIVYKLDYNIGCIVNGERNLKSVKLEKMGFFEKLKKKIFKS